jgi:small subunit ribosomal protein S20
MPIIKSAKKRMRQDVRRNARNRMRRSSLRTSIRRLHEAIEAGDGDAIQTQWVKTQGLIDRTARLGIMHRNAAARTKSRLARRVQQASSS